MRHIIIPLLPSWVVTPQKIPSWGPIQRARGPNVIDPPIAQGPQWSQKALSQTRVVKHRFPTRPTGTQNFCVNTWPNRPQSGPLLFGHRGNSPGSLFPLARKEISPVVACLSPKTLARVFNNFGRVFQSRIESFLALASNWPLENCLPNPSSNPGSLPKVPCKRQSEEPWFNPNRRLAKAIEKVPVPACLRQRKLVTACGVMAPGAVRSHGRGKPNASVAHGQDEPSKSVNMWASGQSSIRFILSTRKEQGSPGCNASAV